MHELATAVTKLVSFTTGHEAPKQHMHIGLVGIDSDDHGDDELEGGNSSIAAKVRQANENIKKLNCTIPKAQIKYVPKPPKQDESEIFFKDCYEPEFE